MHTILGMIVGIVYVASPGPVALETLRRGMKGGIGDSLAVQMGSFFGTILYATLVLSGAGWLLQGAPVQMALGVGGSAVLCYLGVVAIRNGRDLLQTSGGPPSPTASPWRAFWTGTALILVNPLALVFWLSMASPAAPWAGDGSAALLAGFCVGYVVASLALAILAGICRSRIPGRLALTVSWISGLALMGCGVRLGYVVGQTYLFA